MALTSIAETLEDMAEERARPYVYLSSLDPGVGKTTCIIAFIIVLLASAKHRRVGVLVCVQRRNQIRDIVRAAGLDEHDYAVLTGKDAEDLIVLGCGDPKKAQVLFTTHSMVEKRTDGRSFSEVSALHYKGRPRQVRIWDEAILPGQALTISRDILGILFAPFRAKHPRLAEAIERLFSELKSLESGATYVVPDFSAEYGVDLNEALGVVQDNPQQQRAVEVLWFLSGKVVTVRKDGAIGHTMLDYRDTLPDDIKPILALDASARVRTIYDRWNSCRGGAHETSNGQETLWQSDDWSVGTWRRKEGVSREAAGTSRWHRINDQNPTRRGLADNPP